MTNAATITSLAEICAAMIREKAEANGISAGRVADAGLDVAADWALRGVIETLTSKRREIVYLATDQIVA